MAELYKNDRGHLIIKMNAEEATKINFGIKVTPFLNVLICGTCNVKCDFDEIYYVAAINDILCEKCVEDYGKNANHFLDNDSLTYEIRHFNHYAKLLGMKERAKPTANGTIEIYEEDNEKSDSQSE